MDPSIAIIEGRNFTIMFGPLSYINCTLIFNTLNDYSQRIMSIRTIIVALFRIKHIKSITAYTNNKLISLAIQSKDVIIRSGHWHKSASPPLIMIVAGATNKLDELQVKDQMHHSLLEESFDRRVFPSLLLFQKMRSTHSLSMANINE